MSLEEKCVSISLNDVCNYGLLPISMHANPVYLTVKQIVENPDIEYEKTIIYRFYKYIREHPSFEGTCTHFEIFNIFANDEHNLDYNFLKNIKYDEGFLPWRYHRSSGKLSENMVFKTKRQDEKYYAKIIKLIQSIRALGYKPENFKKEYSEFWHGHITGHILQEKNEKRYFITQGQRRIAVFFGLNPTEHIKILLDDNKLFRRKRLSSTRKYLEEKFKKEYFLKDSASWPGVKSNFIKKKEAETLFRCFFKSDDSWIKNTNFKF